MRRESIVKTISITAGIVGFIAAIIGIYGFITGNFTWQGIFDDTPTPPSPIGTRSAEDTHAGNSTQEPLNQSECANAGVPENACSGVLRNTEWSPVDRTVDQVDMVLVPSGCFEMGSTDGDGEQPVSTVCHVRPYWIDQYEVSSGQFSNHGGRASRANFWPGDERPREEITWRESLEYCKQRNARLPSEAEWEYAARGPDSLIYPWGNDFDSQAVIWIENANGQTSNVGSRPTGISWVGAYDMSGNVWEWVNSLYFPYPFNALDGREDTRDSSSMHIIRGGAWGDEAPRLRSSFRFAFDANRPHDGVGFRCARDFE